MAKNTVAVQSSSNPSITHTVWEYRRFDDDEEYLFFDATCTCREFQIHRNCKHLDVLDAGVDEQATERVE
jgi:hypothetical protein